MRLPRLLALFVLAALCGAWFVFQPRLPAAERGRRLAERQGCFGCHGPAGTRGTPASKAMRAAPVWAFG